MERYSITARFVNADFVSGGCDSQVLQCGWVKTFAQVREHGTDEVDAGFHAVGLALAESQPCSDVPYQVTNIKAGQRAFETFPWLWHIGGIDGKWHDLITEIIHFLLLDKGCHDVVQIGCYGVKLFFLLCSLVLEIVITAFLVKSMAVALFLAVEGSRYSRPFTSITHKKEWISLLTRPRAVFWRGFQIPNYLITPN